MRHFIGFHVQPEMYDALIKQLQIDPYESLSEMIRDIMGQYLIYKGYKLTNAEIQMRSKRLKGF